ncbi:hypothetical protein FHG87_007579 [Trinorchestia longiramus]|nr:hypothetical protein FHG87_007579 [Trinorchestia longiramus]
MCRYEQLPSTSPPPSLLSKPLHLSSFPPQHLTVQSLPPPPLHLSLQSIYPNPPLKGSLSILSRSVPLSSFLPLTLYITQQTLPKPLTSSVIKELETKAGPRLTANEKLHNPHSGVHKALPERSTKLTTEDPNVRLNSVRGVLNTPAHIEPTASATPASNKRGETTNNEEDCQSTAEVLRSTVTWPVQDSKAKHHLAYTYLRDFLVLPSKRKLQYITSSIDKDQVLRETLDKVQTLQQKNVFLLVDEVQIRPTVSISATVPAAGLRRRHGGEFEFK